MSEMEEIRNWIEAAERIVALTGAGISTDSGIPDFRGPQGLWTKNPKAEKMATLKHYVADPEVREAAWQSRQAMFGSPRDPNPGHLALVELEQQGKLQAILTQNVDGLHQQAGSAEVIELHGNIMQTICSETGQQIAVPSFDFDFLHLRVRRAVQNHCQRLSSL